MHVAEDLPSRGLVALKMLRPEFAASPTARESFRSEALATLRIRHPHIAAVLAIGVHDGDQCSSPWIAYEYVPGRTLRHVVEERGPVSLRLAAAVAEGVLLALRAAHRVGLVHRDVSPSNVMLVGLDEAGRRAPLARLLDFGLAGMIGQSALGHGPRGEPVLYGNPHFVSPEHALGKAVNDRGDLYQLAATLFFAITGRPPFIGTTAEEIVQAHVALPAPPASAFVASIPSEWDRFLARGLAKQPHTRFRDADAMLVALDRLSAGDHGMRPAKHARSRAAIALDGGPPFPSAALDATLALDATTTSVLNPAPSAAPGEVTERLPLAIPGAAQREIRRSPRSPARFGSTRRRAIVAARLAVAAALAASIAAGSTLAGAQQPSTAPDTRTALGSISPGVASSDSPPSSSGPVEEPEPSSSAGSDAGAAAAAAVNAYAVLPEVVGRTFADARQLLEAAGLTLGEVEPVLSPIAGDTVLRVVPPAGSTLSRGSPVDIAVASGSNVVPDIVGMEFESAATAIRESGFEVELRIAWASPLHGGRVIDADPGIGTLLRLGSVVSLTRAESASPTPAPSSPSTE